MKTLPLCVCSIALAATALAQPSPPAPPSAPSAPSPVVSASATASVSPGSNLADRLHQKLDKKLHGRHGIVIDGDKDVDVDVDKVANDIPEFVLPIVVVSLLTVFGAPVLIVAVIMYFGFSKSRMQHRTVRMLAEKGQPIPAALLAPPTPAVRLRSDMRRGVVLTMIGVGIMLFLGATNEWEGGSWTLGLIPLLIGVGYLVVWKLEGGKKNEIPPPPPTP
jgi:uncharacterized protein DUF6249